MPSDHPSTDAARITGRCYCGASRISAKYAPDVVTYCHCSDCRRITGAPVAAFAAFDADDVTILPGDIQPKSFVKGVARWACPECGSPLAATFDYLPDMIYVPVGIIDQVAEFPPQLHSHHQSCLSWLHINDDLPREDTTARAALLAHRTSTQ